MKKIISISTCWPCSPEFTPRAEFDIQERAVNFFLEATPATGRRGLHRFGEPNITLVFPAARRATGDQWASETTPSIIVHQEAINKIGAMASRLTGARERTFIGSGITTKSACR